MPKRRVWDIDILGFIVCQAGEQIAVNCEKALNGKGSAGGRDMSATRSPHIFSVVKAFVDGRVEELGEMADGQTTIAGPGRRSAALDVVEDGLRVGFGY